jgi:uncharacterized protein with FMN-binding domain
VKRIVLWFMSTLTVVTLLFGYHTSTSSTSGTAASVIASPAERSASGASTSGGGTSASARTVTGPSVDTRWGPVQVEVTVVEGELTDVAVVDYPSENGKDRAINARAVPILVQEALDARSADIDMVSGATVTSEGYVESLQAALDEAGL